MSTSIDALRLRAALGRDVWRAPQPFGPDGWTMSNPKDGGSVIVTCAEWDGVDWVHASIAAEHQLPTYGDLARLHDGAFTGYSYQVFAPPEWHVNIHPNALHLWGRLDGRNVLPNFGEAGTI